MRGGGEYEDSGCYSVKGGSKDKRKRMRRHRSIAHVVGGEVKNKGGGQEEGSGCYIFKGGIKRTTNAPSADASEEEVRGVN